MMNDYLTSGYIGVIAFYGFFLYVFTWAIKRKRKNERNRKGIFFQTLDNGFTENLINTTKDILQIYQGIYPGTEDNRYSGAINKLNEYRIHLINQNEIIDGKIELNKKDVIEKLSIFVKELENATPFSFLPTTERMPFTEIMDYCDSGNYEAIRNKIKDVSHILQGKNDTIEKVTKSNKWSVPLAVIGLIFTVIFGLASLTN